MAPDTETFSRITGAELREFVISTNLLCKINACRGKPTRLAAGSEGDSDLELQTGPELRRKFLDSFALICSTADKGSKTASAICLEQSKANSTSVLRLARNYGVSSMDLVELEKVLQALVAASNGEKLAAQVEDEILLTVAHLDRSRILSLVDKLERNGIRESWQLGVAKLRGRHQEHTDPKFRAWFENSPLYLTEPAPSSSPNLKSVVEWASQGRWTYAKNLQHLLGYRQASPVAWLEDLHKLARYSSSVKSMVKFAVKDPQVFTRIEIRAIQAAPQTSSPIPSNNKPLLRQTIKRITGTDPEIIVEELARRWDTENVEEYFRKACRGKLTLHAEMQLLDFYNRNPECIPQQRFMGTSKKACFLCHEFLGMNSLGFKVSACHQKVYPSWMVPPVRVWIEFKNFSRRIEQHTATALRTELRDHKREVYRDSTAGPTLTVSATIPTEILARHRLRM